MEGTKVFYISATRINEHLVDISITCSNEDLLEILNILESFVAKRANESQMKKMYPKQGVALVENNKPTY